MTAGAATACRWIALNGRGSFDLHGGGANDELRFENGNGVTGVDGAIVTAVARQHGEFWHKLDAQGVSVTLSVLGNSDALTQLG